MVLVFIGFANLLKDAGFSTATIQRDVITHDQVSTLFWLNVGLSIICMSIIIASSPIIAWLYQEPQLTWISVAISGSFILSGLTIQHQAILRRQMRFGTLALINIASIFFSTLVAIFLALQGFAFWSLVGMHISQAAVNAALVWFICRWRPNYPKRGVKIRAMVVFGGNLTVSNFLIYCIRNLDNLLIGSLFGATALGLYSKAYQLLMMPITQINGPISVAVLPALSRLQNDPERFRRFYLKGISYLSFVGMPVVVFSFIAADQIIGILLGSGWDDAVILYRVLAPAALIGTLNVVTGWIFIPLGQGKKQLKAASFGSFITMVALLVGIRWGTIGVAVAFSCSEMIKRLPQIMYACAGSPITVNSIWMAIYQPMISSLAGGTFCLFTMNYFKNNTNLIALFYLWIVFIIIYVSVFFLFPSSKHFLKNFLYDIKLSIKKKRMV
ncbi:lipopolysaccharide biosynthesis protein [Desulfosarcina alkanivorans]|uniref:Lipopolysaccharide biosynthesis protein n=2 Tax=Desulfosarcina alkanivorans TaxID=571177 RepID=A0A5K7YKA9_9BACT|nr:lipopolysaccharide biosynthesis protein [Desulfosarcina alkanivorans]